MPGRARQKSWGRRWIAARSRSRSVSDAFWIFSSGPAASSRAAVNLEALFHPARSVTTAVTASARRRHDDRAVKLARRMRTGVKWSEYRKKLSP
jgi:hypothetical protein